MADNATQKDEDFAKLQEIFEFLELLQKREWVKETGRDFIVAQQASGINGLIVALQQGN